MPHNNTRKFLCMLFGILICITAVAAVQLKTLTDEKTPTLSDISQLLTDYLSVPVAQSEAEQQTALKITDITKAIDEYINTPITQKTPKVCLLDITKKISEIELSNRNVYSAEYMLEVAGISSFTTQSLEEALEKSTMILISSEVKKNAFTAAELVQLKQWVEDGGILISPALTSVNSNTDATAATRDLFGVSASSQNKNRYRLLWSSDHYEDKELEYIDQPEERTTSLGQGKKLTGESIKTFAYTLTDDANADILARFDDGTSYHSRTRYNCNRFESCFSVKRYKSL